MKLSWATWNKVTHDYCWAASEPHHLWHTPVMVVPASRCPGATWLERCQGSYMTRPPCTLQLLYSYGLLIIFQDLFWINYYMYMCNICNNSDICAISIYGNLCNIYMFAAISWLRWFIIHGKMLCNWTKNLPSLFCVMWSTTRVIALL